MYFFLKLSSHRPLSLVGFAITLSHFENELSYFPPFWPHPIKILKKSLSNSFPEINAQFNFCFCFPGGFYMSRILWCMCLLCLYFAILTCCHTITKASLNSMKKCLLYSKTHVARSVVSFFVDGMMTLSLL